MIGLIYYTNNYVISTYKLLNMNEIWNNDYWWDRPEHYQLCHQDITDTKMLVFQFNIMQKYFYSQTSQTHSCETDCTHRKQCYKKDPQ